MNRVELACRVFFWILFNKQFRDEFKISYFEKNEAIEATPEEVPAVPEQKPLRSDAVQFLAMLQREGRLVDFLKEPIDAYSDAQIGAAVRDVHRGCGAVLDQVFSIEAVADNDEGEKMVVSDFNPERFRLTGNVTGTPPYEGVLRHKGWKATKCELPLWQGNEESVDVITPAELELP